MLYTGPFALVLDVPQALDSPYVGTPAAATCQVQNVSGFSLVVTSKGDEYPIPPFTAATVPVDGTQTITVNPVEELSNVGSVTLLWMLQGETSPVPSGPVTATVVNVNGTVTITAGTVEIGGQPIGINLEANLALVDVLVANDDLAITGGILSEATGTAEHQYAGVLVQLGEYEAHPLDYPIGVFVQNTTKGIGSQFQTMVSSSLLLWFGVPADIGDTIAVFVVSPTSQTVVVNVFGLGESPGNSPTLRSDGRLPVVGTEQADTGTSGATLVAAPGFGLSILVKSMSYVASSAGTGGAINGTLGGVNAPLLGLLSVPGALVRDFGNGLLLDSDTALTAPGGTTGDFTASVIYDIVY